jgi:hypothetical protein
MAVTSISINKSGWMSFETSTIVATGLTDLKNSAWALPAASHLEMSVTYIRVRTTSFIDAPASCSAFSIFRKINLACSYKSPLPAMRSRHLQ